MVEIINHLMILLIKLCVIEIIFVPIGGVTVTGGEPLLQVKFLIELFTKLKEYHIHTCIDTSRYGCFD